MNTAPPHTNTPAAGDLLITKNTASLGGYTLRTRPGPAQLWYSTYDQALERAKQWSAASGVTIWRSGDNDVFTRVALTRVQRAV